MSTPLSFFYVIFRENFDAPQKRNFHNLKMFTKPEELYIINYMDLIRS